MIEKYKSEGSKTLLKGGKVILIGASGVGKTCLFNRLIHNKFEDNYKVTIGFDFLSKMYNMFGIEFETTIWDTSGEEKYSSITENYFRQTDCALLCYDVTDHDSFDSTQDWLERVKENANEDCNLFLVGCKCDKFSSIEEHDVKNFAQKIGAEFWETSSKQNLNVHKLFKRVCFHVFEKILKGKFEVNEGEEGFTVKKTVISIENNKKCKC